MSEELFLMQIMMALLGGPVMAFGFKADFSKKAFEKRKAKFAASGKGKDPETDLYGPHKSFWQNYIAGTIFFVVLGVAVRLGAGFSGAV